MYAENQSGQTLRTFGISHTWDGNTDNLSSPPSLDNGARSRPQNITSGYVQYDWYTIQVTFDNGVSKQQDFYCNSSSSHNRVDIVIYSSHVDCRYYVDDNYDTGCLDKGWT